MTKEEYIRELRARISHLPKEEQESALRYYMEYLEDAGDRPMEQIIEELGTPQQVAERIIADCAQSAGEEKSAHTGCVLGTLAVVTSPVWLLVLFVAGILGATLLFTIALLIFVFGVVALALIGVGIWSLNLYPATGIAVLGGALICAGLTLLCVALFWWAAGAVKSVWRTRSYIKIL